METTQRRPLQPSTHLAHLSLPLAPKLHPLLHNPHITQITSELRGTYGPFGQFFPIIGLVHFVKTCKVYKCSLFQLKTMMHSCTSRSRNCLVLLHACLVFFCRVCPSLTSLSHTYTTISLRREHTSGLVHRVPLPRLLFSVIHVLFYPFLIKNGLYMVCKRCKAVLFIVCSQEHYMIFAERIENRMQSPLFAWVGYF